MERWQAIANRQTRYQSDKPCKNGHIWRYTKTNQCCDCLAANTKKWRELTNGDESLDRSGYIRLHDIVVHKLAYQTIIDFINATHAMLGIPSERIAAIARPISVIGLPREWAKNPFHPGPSMLPVSEILARLEIEHANGQMLNINESTLTNRLWTNVPK